MNLSSRILGMNVEAAKKLILSQMDSAKISIVVTQGGKDKDILTVARVIRAHVEDDENVELTVSYFSSPL